MFTKEDARRGGQSTFGERKGTAKLNAEIVRAIRASDEATATVARMFGISHSQASRVRSREHWKHIE